MSIIHDYAAIRARISESMPNPPGAAIEITGAIHSLCPAHPFETWSGEEGSAYCTHDGCGWTRDPLATLHTDPALLAALKAAVGTEDATDFLLTEETRKRWARDMRERQAISASIFREGYDIDSLFAFSLDNDEDGE